MSAELFLLETEARRRKGRGARFALLGLALMLGLVGALGGAIGAGLYATIVLGLGLSLASVTLVALAKPVVRYAGGRLIALSPIGARLGVGVAILSAIASCAAAGVLGLDMGLGGIIRVTLGALLVVAFLTLCLPNLLRPGPVLIIDENGYFDRRCTHAPIAWERVTALEWIGKGATIGYKIQIAPNESLIGAAWLTRRFGERGLLANCLGLNCDPGDVLLAIRTYRPDLLEVVSAEAAA